MGRQQGQANKNKTVETISSGTMSNYGFSIPSGGYDNEDRLTSFNRTVGLTQSWNLSLVGDWNSVTTNGTAQARTHGPSHELLTGVGQAVSTDVKGNITVIPAALLPSGVALAMTWDFDNRMATAVTGSTTVSHKYDALGRRVARTEGANTTIYAQSGQQTVCDYVAGAAPSASTYRYLFASYIDEPVVRITTSGSVATYLHRNQQYSITALTNSTGAVVERYAYTTYGVPTITNASGTVLTSSAQNNRYLYTGREWDGAISLYHYRARMYDASLGRFCSRDPIGFKGSPWLLYEYVHGMPLVKADPTGKIAPAIPVIVGGAVILTEAEAIAAAAGLTLAACLADPNCSQAVHDAIGALVEEALDAMSELKRLAYQLSCQAMNAAYHQLQDNVCGRCDPSRATNVCGRVLRCARSAAMTACWGDVIAMRTVYVGSGCDYVLNPNIGGHVDQIGNNINAMMKCARSASNNCS